MINYKQAKALKDAGFPQGKGSYYVNGEPWDETMQSDYETPSTPNRDTWVYILTLSELIEACGKEFKSLLNFNGESNATWQAEAHNFKGHGQGKTPEEAVKNLWLKINKKNES